MKTRNRVTKSLTLLAMGLSLVVIATVWRGGRVAAIGNPDIQPEFGLLSLAAGQTARFNAVNRGGPDTMGDPNGRLARRVTLAFDIYGISDPNDSPIRRVRTTPRVSLIFVSSSAFPVSSC
jgi:hypothetical protein